MAKWVGVGVTPPQADHLSPMAAKALILYSGHELAHLSIVP
jgi:hypothetical protein